jgi:hypothetical protein
VVRAYVREALGGRQLNQSQTRGRSFAPMGVLAVRAARPGLRRAPRRRARAVRAKMDCRRGVLRRACGWECQRVLTHAHR